MDPPRARASSRRWIRRGATGTLRRALGSRGRRELSEGRAARVGGSETGADNQHCKYVDGSYRGYARCDVTPELWLTTFKGVVTAPPNGNVVDPNAPSYTAAAFAVESGAPGAQRV